MANNTGNSQSVGGIHFDIGVKGAEQAKAELGAVGAAAQKAGTEGAAGAEKLEGGFKNFSKSIRQSIAAVTGLVASLTAAAGIATLFYKLGEQIREAFLSAATAAKEFSDTVIGGAESRLKAYEEEIEQLKARAETYARLGGKLGKSFAEENLKEAAILENKAIELRKNIRAAAEGKARAEAAKLQEDFDRKNHELALKQQKERQDQEDKWAQEREEKARSFQEFMLSSTKKLREENDKIAEAASKARQEQEKALAAIREQVRVANSLVNNASTVGSFSSDEVLRELQYISSRVGGGTP